MYCQKWALKLLNTDVGNKTGIVRLTLKIFFHGFRSLNSMADFKIIVTSVFVNNYRAYVSNLVCGLLHPLHTSSHSQCLHSIFDLESVLDLQRVW